MTTITTYKNFNIPIEDVSLSSIISNINICIQMNTELPQSNQPQMTTETSNLSIGNINLNTEAPLNDRNIA